MIHTFSEFKKNFYARLPDLSILDCEDHNLLKVVLDGLKVDYAAKGIRNDSLFISTPINDVLLFLKSTKYRKSIQSARKLSKELSGRLKAKFLLFDNGRVAEDAKGKKVSFYFNKIEAFLGEDNCTTIYQKKTDLNRGPQVKDLYFSTLFSSYSRKEKTYISNLKRVYQRIEGLNVFSQTELLNIRVAITKFFDEFRFWNYILQDGDVKCALFDEHYHREGFILALKRNKIAAIELQHGLIAIEDIFYIMPEQVRKVAPKALFPDKIFTYGRYWSEILKKGYEFESDQIDILGLYQEINTQVTDVVKSTLHNFLNGNEFILVTTQIFLQEYFIGYVNWLSADLKSRFSSVKIVVKTHPSEKLAVYEELMRLDNVLLVTFNTEYLLSKCKWHVSCYSTTLYEALKYSCENFSLEIEICRDYIDTITGDGISVLIKKEDNPAFIKGVNSQINFDRTTLFENFDSNKHKLKALRN